MKRNKYKFSNTEFNAFSIVIVVAYPLIMYTLKAKTEIKEIGILLVACIILALINLPRIRYFLDSPLAKNKIEPTMEKNLIAVMTIFSITYVIINLTFLYGALHSKTVPNFISNILNALNCNPKLIPILILVVFYGLCGGFSIKFLELLLRHKSLLYSAKSSIKNGLLFLFYIPLSFGFHIGVGTIFSSAFDIKEVKYLNDLVTFFLLITLYVSGQFFEPLIERTLEQHSNKSKPRNIIFQVLNPANGKPVEISNDIIVTLKSDNGPIQIKISKSEE